MYTKIISLININVCWRLENFTSLLWSLSCLPKLKMQVFSYLLGIYRCWNQYSPTHTLPCTCIPPSSPSVIGNSSSLSFRPVTLNFFCYFGSTYSYWACPWILVTVCICWSRHFLSIQPEKFSFRFPLSLSTCNIVVSNALVTYFHSLPHSAKNYSLNYLVFVF